MKQLYKQIEGQQDIRKILIEMRAGIKEKGKKEELQELFDERPQVLRECLYQDDPKARRNAALLLGELTGKENAGWIWEAYEREGQMFVKADYLKALSAFDCAPYLDAMKARHSKLEEVLSGGGRSEVYEWQSECGEKKDAGSEKHLRAELQELRKILLSGEKPVFHAFIGSPPPADVILLTNRGCERATADQIPTGRVRLIKGAVQVERADVAALLGIRTYREMLFCLEGSRKLSEAHAAAKFLQTNWRELLGSLLKGGPPYYFRIDVKGRMPLAERSRFCQRLGAQLEQASAGALKNAPSAYEIELRLTENKEGGFWPLLKLQALPDKRFSYRKNIVAASMAPVQAAICMELASPYLKGQARVLDPFCGVGTMLLERNYKLHASALYGIDVYGAAVQGARENARIAGVPAYFINRDSLTFTHEYRFDEIVTNFPTQGRNLDAHALDCLYGRFFDKARELLEPDGMILLYSHDRGYVKKHVGQPCWKMVQEWRVSEKEGAYLFCIAPAGAGCIEQG